MLYAEGIREIEGDTKLGGQRGAFLPDLDKHS